MHKIAIPAAQLARIEHFRAERHMIKSIDPRRTAHVVVDMQVGFMAPGAPVEVPVTREIVANLNRITRALRDAGGTIVYLRFTADAGALASWTAFYDMMFSPERRTEMAESFAHGNPNFELWPELDVRAGDWIVDKTRYSAFIPGTCDLHERLQAAGIDTLIITGTVTNCCCESTARDAMQRDYKVIFVSDGNAALTDDDHNGTLGNMASLFADVMDTDEVLALCPTQVRKVA